MTLPVSLRTDIDASYADTGDPSRKLHQQNHDAVHALYNALVVDGGGGVGTIVAATHQWVVDQITALIGGAPGALDTLNELATALGDDASFATTVTNALATKAARLTRTAVQTANYTAAAGDLVPCDTTSAAITVTLPSAPAVGSRVAVKLVTLGAGHAVTVACGGSDVFNKTAGATTASLTLLNQAIQVQYDTGGIWTVVADDIPKSQLDATYAPLGGPFGPTSTGATAATRFVGGTASGAPASGSFLVGDFVIDQTGRIWVCTTAGSPGTWTQAGGGSGGSVSLTPTAVKTSNYTAAAGDLVPCSATGGGFTVTLPTSPTVGTIVGVYKSDASANVVTVAPGGGGTIDGQSTATAVTQYAGGTFECISGNTWKLVATYSTVGPAGPTGPTGPVGAGGYVSIGNPGYISGWYPCTSVPSGQANSARALTAGTMVVGTPFVAQENFTISQVGAYLTTNGSAGSVLRFGIWQVSGANPFDITLGSAYGSLLVDAGTVAADAGAPTPKTITLGTPLAITSGTAFVIGVVAQTAGCSVYAEGLSNSWWSPWGSSTSILNGGNFAFTVAGVTGAMPSTLTPGAFFTTSIGGAGWFKRSA